MIHFQRGIDPAKKMDIGQHAIAPEIEYFFILDPEVMAKDPVTDKAIPSFQKIVGEHFWTSILKKKQLKRNPRFIGVSFNEEVNGQPAGAIHRLNRLSGTFVKFGGESERLPKWNSKGEVI
jgi:hypothetical protein